MLFSILWDVFKLIHALHGWLWSCEKIILAWKHVSRIKATTWRREQPNNIQVSSEWICYAVAKMKNLLKCHFGHNSTSMYCIGKIFSVLDSLQSLLSKYVTFWLIGCMQIYKKRALWGVGFFGDTLYEKLSLYYKVWLPHHFLLLLQHNIPVFSFIHLGWVIWMKTDHICKF